jgi:hypothetical protein
VENFDMYIVWQFGVLCEYLVYFVVVWFIFLSFTPFWYVVEIQIWQPWLPRVLLFAQKRVEPFGRSCICHGRFGGFWWALSVDCGMTWIAIGRYDMKMAQ